jgi:hypothetical protein
MRVPEREEMPAMGKKKSKGKGNKTAPTTVQQNESAVGERTRARFEKYLWALEISAISIGLSAYMSGMFELTRLMCVATGLLLGVMWVREQNFKRRDVVMVLGLLSIGLAVRGMDGHIVRQRDAVRLTNLDGAIQPIPLKGSARGVVLGGNVGLFSGDSLVVVRIHGRDLLTLRREGGGYFIDASVFSDDGRIVAQVERNRFVVNPNNYFRISRRDQSTLAVYDQKADPVLTVAYRRDGMVLVGGIFRYNGESVRITRSSIETRTKHFSSDSSGNLYILEKGSALLDVSADGTVQVGAEPNARR